MDGRIVVGTDEGSYAVNGAGRTITLSNLTFTPVIEDIALITNITTGKTYYCPTEGLTSDITLAGLVVTVGANPGDTMQNTDDVHIQLWTPQRPTSLPNVEKHSPTHFSVAYTSASTVTLSGLPISITDNSQIRFVQAVDGTANLTYTYQQGVGGVTITESSNVLTIYRNGSVISTLNTNMKFYVGLNSTNTGDDDSQDIKKVIEQSPVWSRYTSVETIVSTAQELDATPTDAGSEIDMQGYNELALWGTIDIGTSTNFQVRILHKHTSAGAEEYREVSLDIGNPVATQTRVNYNDYIVLPDSDGLFKLEVNVANTTPYVQIQVFDEADGDGQLDALYITKAWSPSK